MGLPQLFQHRTRVLQPLERELGLGDPHHRHQVVGIRLNRGFETGERLGIATGAVHGVTETGQRARRLGIDLERLGIGALGVGDARAREMNVAEQGLSVDDLFGAGLQASLEDLLEHVDALAFLVARRPADSRQQDSRPDVFRVCD